MATDKQAKMIKEIREVQKEACSEWEVEFLDSLYYRAKSQQPLSPRQAETLEKLYKKICASPL